MNQTVRPMGDAFDFNNLVNAISKNVSDLANASSAKAAKDSANAANSQISQLQAAINQMTATAQHNQTPILAGVAILAVGIVAFSVMKKKKHG